MIKTIWSLYLKFPFVPLLIGVLIVIIMAACI